jgi:hypothetical protein
VRVKPERVVGTDRLCRFASGSATCGRRAQACRRSPILRSARPRPNGTFASMRRGSQRHAGGTQVAIRRPYLPTLPHCRRALSRVGLVVWIPLWPAPNGRGRRMGPCTRTAHVTSPPSVSWYVFGRFSDAQRACSAFQNGRPFMRYAAPPGQGAPDQKNKPFYDLHARAFEYYISQASADVRRAARLQSSSAP